MNFAWLITLMCHPTFLVGIGGAAGSNARYWLGHWFRQQPWAKDYYWGTFTINLSGSFILGLVAVLFKDRLSPGFLLLGSGFCGGYTTFSTFSMEVAETIHRGRWDLALTYVLTSVIGGFLGFFVAWSVSRQIV